MVQKHIFPNDNLGKLAREAQQLASEKEKQDWKSNQRKLWFKTNSNPIPPKIKIPTPNYHNMN